MSRLLSTALPWLLGMGCLLTLTAVPATDAIAQVSRSPGEYRRPAQVLPSHRPAYRPSQRPSYQPAHRPGHRPGLARPPGHRPGWANDRPVAVYPRHHHQDHYDNDNDNAGAAIVGGLVAGALIGIIVNGLQDDSPK